MVVKRPKMLHDLNWKLELGPSERRCITWQNDLECHTSDNDLGMVVMKLDCHGNLMEREDGRRCWVTGGSPWCLMTVVVASYCC